MFSPSRLPERRTHLTPHPTVIALRRRSNRLDHDSPPSLPPLESTWFSGYWHKPTPYSPQAPPGVSRHTVPMSPSCYVLLLVLRPVRATHDRIHFIACMVQGAMSIYVNMHGKPTSSLAAKARSRRSELMNINQHVLKILALNSSFKWLAY